MATDVLFGKEDGTELAGEFDLKDYETLAGWGERDWKDLINKFRFFLYASCRR